MRSQRYPVGSQLLALSSSKNFSQTVMMWRNQRNTLLASFLSFLSGSTSGWVPYLEEKVFLDLLRSVVCTG